MFRYLLIGLLVYWIVKRVFKVSDAVRKDNQHNGTTTSPKSTANKPKVDNHGGEYVDFKELD